MATNTNTKRVREARETIADRAATVAQDFHEVGDAAKQMATHGVAAVRDTAYQYLDEGRSRVLHLGDGVQSKVQDQPLRALLIAAGVGFLIGAIWTRR